MRLTQTQQDSTTAATAFSGAWSAACKLEGKAMLDAISAIPAANAAAIAVGIDPVKVGLN